MEVLRLLGCTHKTLRRLRERGLLLPSVSDEARPKALWRYNSGDVDAFLDRYVTSAAAANIVGCARSSLDEAARDGRLPEGAIAFVGRFTLQEARAEGASHVRKAVRRYDRMVLTDWVQDRIGSTEAAALLGVTLNTISVWGRRGLLHRIGSTWYSRREVLEWRDKRLSTKDVALRFGVDPVTVARWVRLGWLLPVARVGKNGKWCYFSRDDIERMEQELVTIEEAASLLGVHRATVESWYRAGKLPSFARGIMGRVWFDRSTITKLQSIKSG
jgi:excisionase family DNA binding protein